MDAVKMSYPNDEEHQKAAERLYGKYDLLNTYGNTNIHFIPMDVFDIDKLKMNFDIVLCFGLYYHVKNIYGLFELCYNKCNDITVIEGPILPRDDPFIYMNEEFEMHNDCTNYWAVTPSGLVKMLLRIGFNRVEVAGARGPRLVFVAYKNPEKEK